MIDVVQACRQRAGIAASKKFKVSQAWNCCPIVKHKVEVNNKILIAPSDRTKVQ